MTIHSFSTFATPIPFSVAGEVEVASEGVEVGGAAVGGSAEMDCPSMLNNSYVNMRGVLGGMMPGMPPLPYPSSEGM